MFVKTLDNSCPYCGSHESTYVKDRLETQKVYQCDGCTKHHIKANRGRAYPLFESDNQDSEPVTMAA